MQFEITEINRLIANLIRIGTIAEVDDAKALARVQIGAIKTDWLPWVSNRAGDCTTWWRPDPDEQVLVLSPSGDTAQGIIVLGIYGNGDQPNNNPDEHTTKYKDGTTITYNRQTSHLTVNCVGDITVTANHTTINTTTTHNGNVSINGSLNVSGNTDIGGNTSVGGNTTVSGTLASKGGMSGAGGLSFEGHVHTDGDGETTGTPR
jgi:phage baseplate assembly protein V